MQNNEIKIFIFPKEDQPQSLNFNLNIHDNKQKRPNVVLLRSWVEDKKVKPSPSKLQTPSWTEYTQDDDLTLLDNLDAVINFQVRSLFHHVLDEVEEYESPLDSRNKKQASSDRCSHASNKDQISLHKRTLTTIEASADVQPRVFRASKLRAKEKPPYTYSQLITTCLQEMGAQTVHQIYQWISTRHPYYVITEDGWKNAVRHNLSMHARFIKGHKLRGKSHVWHLANDVASQKPTHRLSQYARTMHSGNHVFFNGPAFQVNNVVGSYHDVNKPSLFTQARKMSIALDDVSLELIGETSPIIEFPKEENDQETVPQYHYCERPSNWTYLCSQESNSTVLPSRPQSEPQNWMLNGFSPLKEDFGAYHAVPPTENRCPDISMSTLETGENIMDTLDAKAAEVSNDELIRALNVLTQENMLFS